MGPCCVKPRSGSVAFQTNFWLREGCANPSYPGKGMNDFLAVGDYCDEGIHHLLIMGTSCMKPGTGSVCGLPDPFLVVRRLREGCATGSLLLSVVCSKKKKRVQKKAQGESEAPTAGGHVHSTPYDRLWRFHG